MAKWCGEACLPIFKVIANSLIPLEPLRVKSRESRDFGSTGINFSKSPTSQEVLTSATHFLISEVDILSGFYTRSFLIWGKEQWNSTLVFATWEVSILLLGFSACFFCHESSGKLPRIIIRDLDRRIRGEALSPQQFLSSFASWFSGDHAIWRLNYLKSQVIFASKNQETYHLGLINQTLLTPLLLT